MIDKETIFLAIGVNHPKGFEGFNPAVPSPNSYDEYLSALLPGFDPLTADEIKDGAAQAREIYTEAIARKKRREELRGAWDALPSWITGPYRMQFDAANSLLDEGKDDQAIEMIRYEEPRAAFTDSQKQIFETEKDKIIKLIESL